MNSYERIVYRQEWRNSISRKTRKFIPLTLGIILLWGFNAAAVTTYYTNEATFLAATSTTLESFEGLTAGFVASVVVTDFTMTDSSASFDVRVIPFPPMPTDGVNFVVNFAPPGPEIYTFTFSSPISAFGINIGDLATIGASPVVFGNDAGDAAVIATPVLPALNLLFFGVTNDSATFTTVTITNPNVSDGVLFDEIYYSFGGAAPVPVATYWGLGAMCVALALGGAFYVRRLRRLGKV